MTSMTAWWGIYSSKDQKDMLWPDMTWCYILAYDLWNFSIPTTACPPTQESIFVTHSTLDPGAATAVSIAALVATRRRDHLHRLPRQKLGRNPYRQDVFEGTSDWEKAALVAPRSITLTPSNMLVAVGARA